jgi:hypothetical protein
MIDSGENLQIVASDQTWQRAKTLRLPYWMRLAMFVLGTLALALSLLGWISSVFFTFFDLLTGCWIRPWHRFVHRYKRRVRWMMALSLAAVFSGPSPQLAVVFIMSYCYLYSHDAPEKWIQRLSRLSSGL